MKRSYKAMSGATLLEIMLVLAIVALLIVMSVRFYQSASTSNKVNAGMSTVNTIVAAADNFFNVKGTYTGVSSNVANYLPGGKMPSSPWGGDTSVTDISAGSYSIAMPVSTTGTQGTGSAPGTSPCSQLAALLRQNAKFSPVCTTGTGMVVTVTP